MLDDEEEEVEMSEEYSDQEEYMEYSIVQHEVTNLYGRPDHTITYWTLSLTV